MCYWASTRPCASSSPPTMSISPSRSRPNHTVAICTREQKITHLARPRRHQGILHCSITTSHHQNMVPRYMCPSPRLALSLHIQPIDLRTSTIATPDRLLLRTDLHDAALALELSSHGRSHYHGPRSGASRVYGGDESGGPAFDDSDGFRELRLDPGVF